MHFTEYDTRVAAYAVITDDLGRVLLSWFVGDAAAGMPPMWTLPGGGVEYHEGLEEAVVREVREETGYDIELGELLTTRVIVEQERPGRGRGRPFKGVQVVYEATVVGGSLGTLEVDGTTDHAAWVPVADLPGQPAAGIITQALEAYARRHG